MSNDTGNDTISEDSAMGQGEAPICYLHSRYQITNFILYWVRLSNIISKQGDLDDAREITAV